MGHSKTIVEYDSIQLDEELSIFYGSFIKTWYIDNVTQLILLLDGQGIYDNIKINELNANINKFESKIDTIIKLQSSIEHTKFQSLAKLLVEISSKESNLFFLSILRDYRNVNINALKLKKTQRILKKLTFTSVLSNALQIAYDRIINGKPVYNRARILDRSATFFAKKKLTTGPVQILLNFAKEGRKIGWDTSS